jgi:hypothetical protein
MCVGASGDMNVYVSMKKGRSVLLEKNGVQESYNGTECVSCKNPSIMTKNDVP